MKNISLTAFLDYLPIPGRAFFGKNKKKSSTEFTVLSDYILEKTEKFNLGLLLPLVVGETIIYQVNSAEGVITDSTSKHVTVCKFSMLLSIIT